MKKLFLHSLVFLLIVSCGESKKKSEYSGYSQTDPWKNPQLSVDIRVKDLLLKLSLDEKISQMTNNSAAIERLGIPEYDWWNECLHGVARAGNATVFPQAIGMAATFDEDLIFRVASAISDEGRAKYNAAQKLGNYSRYMGLSYWTPNINIFRDPRWGRGQETYGEDPYLTSRIGVAFVKGLQGEDTIYLKTAVCAKHYAIHSGTEGLRHEFNAVPSKKDFVETYLPAFKALVKEAKVEAVMCAYNRTFDQPCCGSPYLLNDILRKEWGFKGYIVSDCWALQDFYIGHNIVKTPVEAAAVALKAGVNVNCGETYPLLKEAVKLGLVTEEDIDKQLAYLLRTRFGLGLFDPPGSVHYNSISKDVIYSKEHVDLAYETAIKSIVLLKNKKNILPLQKNLKDIQIVGILGNDAQVMYGNYYGQTTHATTIAEGITAIVDPGTKVALREGIILTDCVGSETIDYTTSVAKSSDVVIAVMGISNLIEGEEGSSLASSNKGDRIDIGLPKNQVEYIKSIRAGGDAPIILVVTGGSPVSLIEVEDLVDAILFVWYPEEQGGNAIADILFGYANPSGKLPITFPVSINQLPPYEDYSMVNRTYRYMTSEPEFTFGFRLNYTTFAFSNIVLSNLSIKKGESIHAKTTIENKGKIKGEEVVQLYVTNISASTRTPLFALKGFKRLSLNAGEKKTVDFTITPEMMELVTEEGEAIMEPGEFKITIGGASPSTISETLGAPKPVSANYTLK